MRRSLSLLFALPLVAACDSVVYRSPPPEVPSNGEGVVTMQAPGAAPVAAHETHHDDGDHDHHDDGDHDHDEHDHDHDDQPIALSPEAARVLVLQTSVLNRPAEVVGVVDAHEKMGRHDEALAHLKARAAALGADAVVGVEFHHGEGEGEPTHLSGLAVRFLPSPP